MQPETMSDDELATATLQVSQPETPPDKIAEILGYAEGKLAYWKSIVEKIRGAILEHVEETSTTLAWKIDDQGNEREFWAGIDKTNKCISVGAVVDYVLENGGKEDLDNVMSANAIKYGAFKKLLEANGDTARLPEFFEVVEKVKLVEGKPAKQLQEISNTAFLR